MACRAERKEAKDKSKKAVSLGVLITSIPIIGEKILPIDGLLSKNKEDRKDSEYKDDKLWEGGNCDNLSAIAPRREYRKEGDDDVIGEPDGETGGDEGVGNA